MCTVKKFEPRSFSPVSDYSHAILSGFKRKPQHAAEQSSISRSFILILMHHHVHNLYPLLTKPTPMSPPPRLPYLTCLPPMTPTHLIYFFTYQYIIPMPSLSLTINIPSKPIFSLYPFTRLTTIPPSIPPIYSFSHHLFSLYSALHTHHHFICLLLYTHLRIHAFSPRISHVH